MKTLWILSTLLASLTATAVETPCEKARDCEREINTTRTHTGDRGTTTIRTEGSVTGKRGEGCKYEAKHTIVGPKGKTGTATTAGERHKTEDGWKGSSKTIGEGSKGRTWTLGRDTDAVRNQDGTVTVHHKASGTKPNGESVSRSSTATVTKSDAGRSWVVEGKTITAKGCGSWTGQGSATRTDKGVTWETSRVGISPGGKTWSGQGQGEIKRTGEGGAWQSTKKGEVDGRPWKLETKGEFLRPNLGREGAAGRLGGDVCPKK